MKIIGKITVALTATIVCLTFACGGLMPLSLAQAADMTPPVTNATISGSTYNSTSGWYYGGNPVISLSASDNPGGSGVLATYYQLDGGTKYTYSTGTTIPIPEGNHTLAFWSVDNNQNTEILTSGHNVLSFKVDTNPPTLNITINGNLNTTTGNYKGSVTVNLKSSDNMSGVSSIQYSLDGSTWNLFTTNFTLGDGATTLGYRSFDTAGNVNQSSKTITVFNPVITTYPDCNKWYNQYQYGVRFVEPASNDIQYVKYSYEKNTWYTIDMDHPTGFDVFPDGNKSIWCQAIGRSGDIGDVQLIWFGIDTVQPTVGASLEGSLDKAKTWYNSDVTVHFNSNIDKSARQFQYSWDNKSWTNVGDSIKVSKGSSRTIYYRVTDTFGRSAYGSTWIYFAPGSYDQGGMSNQVYINGATAGPSSGPGTGTATAVPIPSTVPLPTPTKVPMPTPTYVPADTGNDQSSGSGAPLAIAVLVGVLVLLGIIAAAAYLFVFKPK